MFSCLCCYPDKAEENTYHVLESEGNNESSKKDPIISDGEAKASEQQIASNEVPSEVIKPSEDTVIEKVKNSQTTENVSDQTHLEVSPETENDKVEPSNAKVPKKASEKEDVAPVLKAEIKTEEKVSDPTHVEVSAESKNDKVDPSNAKVPKKASDKQNVAPELKAEIKTEQDQNIKSGKIEEDKTAENQCEVQAILDEAISVGVKTQDKSKKEQQNMDNDIQASAPKPELAVPDKDKRPAVESIKLNNISRAVVKNANKEQLNNVNNGQEEKVDRN